MTDDEKYASGHYQHVDQQVLDILSRSWRSWTRMIAALAFVKKAFIRASLNSMVTRGLVETKTDGRGQWYRLTREGKS